MRENRVTEIILTTIKPTSRKVGKAVSLLIIVTWYVLSAIFLRLAVRPFRYGSIECSRRVNVREALARQWNEYRITALGNASARHAAVPYHHDVTQAQLEPLDVLDANGNPTGEVKVRGAVHRDGNWHRAIHIWIVREQHLVLLQRRAMTKDLEPGKLDVSVGGHVRAGELFLDAIREAEEELGLALRPGQLAYLGTAVAVRHYPDLPTPVTDREYQDVYVVLDDRALADYQLQVAEVDTLYEVPVDAAIALFRHGTYVAAAGYDSMRRPSHALLVADDLPSQGSELLAQALERVAAYLKGEEASDIAQRPFQRPL